MSNPAPRSLPFYSDPAARRAFEAHPRVWQQNRFVYPVVSRRSRGISIGVNLNPDKVCNFDCIYCSVDRTGPRSGAPDWASQHVDLPNLRAELAAMLEIVRSGEIFSFEPFHDIPPELRRVNDVAFSGDGEPTTCPEFEQAVRLAAELVGAEGTSRESAAIKLVLITNASMFHRPGVRNVLTFMDQHNGEIWAKLDAGTEDYYKRVDRSPVPFTRILDNLKCCCLGRPTVIQTLLMKVHGQGPPGPEMDAYTRQLLQILHAGGRIKLVQFYTVARRSTEVFATPLSVDELENIGNRVSSGLAAAGANVPVEIYP